MFNNSEPTGQPQPQITSASHHSSNQNSRTPNDTPSSRSALELEATLHEDLLTGPRSQGRGQSLVRGTYGHPIPLLPVDTDFWNYASWFPGHSTGNAAGDSSGSDASGYPLASTYGQPMPPNFESRQAGEHLGMFYGEYPPVPAATTNPVPGGYTTPSLPPRPPASANPAPNAQGGAAVWHSYCWINRAERDEVHMTIVLRRSPPA